MISRNSLQKSVFLLALVLSLVPEAFAQEVDYDEEQYGQYTEAVGKEDPEERCEAILDFIRANPKMSLVKYAVVKYIEVLQNYQGQGNYERVLARGEQFLALIPDDINAKYLSGIAAFQLNNFEKAAQYAEAAYASNPNPGLLYILTISNQNLKRTDKFLEYGDQILASLEPKDFLPGHFQIAAGLRSAYAANNLQKSVLYARKIISALDAVNTPEGTSEAQWKQYANAERTIGYAILGQQSVRQKNWSEAISHYQRVTQFTNEKDALAEAYYFIGRGRWEQNRLDPAMEAFAKGSVQKGAQNADACRDALERLYRSTHNGSLAGLDEFIVNVTVR